MTSKDKLAMEYECENTKRFKPFACTVKPLQNNHPLVQINVVFVDRWSLFAAQFLWKHDCLCTKMWPLEAGGRCSRWSLKAGFTAHTESQFIYR